MIFRRASRRVLLSIPLLATLIILAALARERAGAERKTWPPAEDHLFVPSPRAGRVLSLGWNELVADCFWARTLVFYGERMHQNGSLDQVEPLVALVNALDPYFHRPYTWGAFATLFRTHEGKELVSSQDDYRASVTILERGIQYFPEDWELHWVLGIRYVMDLKSDDPEEQRTFQETGSAYLEQAMHLPGSPSDLPLLAATMRTKLGQKQKALDDLREMILITQDEEQKKVLLAKYKSLSSETARNELADAAKKLEAAWLADLPYVPATFYLILGPRPSRAVDLSGEIHLGGPPE